jgi:hypothetical protein
VSDLATDACCRAAILRRMLSSERLVAFLEATLASIDPRRP